MNMGSLINVLFRGIPLSWYAINMGSVIFVLVREFVLKYNSDGCQRNKSAFKYMYLNLE